MIMNKMLYLKGNESFIGKYLFSYFLHIIAHLQKKGETYMKSILEWWAIPSGHDITHVENSLKIKRLFQCMAAERVIQFKHEYLRSRTYICLSLSSPFPSPVIVIQIWPLSRYLCLLSWIPASKEFHL